MQDDFFRKTKCDRCGGELKCRQMSRFNTDCLCPACMEQERQHPDYRKAVEAELEQIKKGNRNFEGIGWPGKDGRVK